MRERDKKEYRLSALLVNISGNSNQPVVAESRSTAPACGRGRGRREGGQIDKGTDIWKLWEVDTAMDLTGWWFHGYVLGQNIKPYTLITHTSLYDNNISIKLFLMDQLI